MISLLLACLLQAPDEASDSKAPEWSVDGDHAPTVPFAYEAEEGTWISLDVSPDGEHLVFDLLGHLYEMPIEGGQARRLTEGKSWNMFPRYSPDGRRIAFTSDRGGSNDLWVLERADGALVNISDMQLPVFQGTWSADGRRLYGTALNLNVRFPAYSFNLFGKRQELVPAGDRTPIDHIVERPGEGALYFEHNDGKLPASGPRIKRFDTRTGELSVYIDRPGGAASPRIAPDASRMVYVHRDEFETVLVVHDFETQKERTFFRGLDYGRFESSSFYGCYPGLAWHPDGQRVFVSFGGKIHSVDVATGATREVPLRAPVQRDIVATARFRAELPTREAHTRAHRWSQPAGEGVLFEALGDLWIAQGDERRNLTQSAAHETNPVYHAGTNAVYYATWSDDELGAVEVLDLAGGEPRRLTNVPSQYGALAVAADAEAVAYMRGDASIRKGTKLENQTRFELVLWTSAGESKVCDVEWIPNRYAKRPPSVLFAPDGESLYFTEYEDGALRLKRIRFSGLGEELHYTFPHATRAVLSPDLRWIAVREYHRTFVTPYEFLGLPISVSAEDEKGFTRRVDAELDGDFTEWTSDGKGLYWTRGDRHLEKSLDAILAETPGAQATELSIPYMVDAPRGSVVLQGVRVLTMNAGLEVLENATILVQGDRIAAVGTDVEVPSDARVFDLSGHTVMPGMFDAHGHYGSPISALNVIEERLYGLHANLAYGVTTMYDVYGTTQKDFWVSDMLRAGRIDGPRLFSVGDPVFVTKYRKKMHRPIDSLADAREIARFNADHGALGLKDYSNHRRAARQQLALACREQGLNLVAESFADFQMNMTQLVDGFTGLEHTFGLAPLYEDVLRLFEATDAGMTPTLIVVYNGPAGETWFHMRERLWEDEKLLHFYRRDDLLRHRRPRHYFEDDFYHPQMAAQLRELHRRGVLLQMGAHGQMMGLGAHWEMELFVHGGFTPHEAIQIATRNGFEHHGLDHELGSIEPGKLADLVILSENPLEDIRNTRTIELVMKNGALYAGPSAARVYPSAEEYRSMYFMAAD